MTDKNENGNWRQATRLVRGGLERSQFMETSEALYLSSGYVYDKAEDAESAFKGDLQRFVYSRYANPTVAMLERRLAALEGAALCMTTASGMGAVFTTLAALVRGGGRLVASRALFGSCEYIISDLLPDFGIESEVIDGTDLGQWERALSRPATAVFLETPSNPTLELVDLAAVCELAHGAGAKVVVDNVFATPVLQHPLEFGADIVIYSATKHIDGQGRVLGGAVLSNDTDFMNDQFMPFMRHTGPTLSAFNAWVLLKGLETLGIRVHQQSASAAAIAAFLEQLPGIDRVFYPGLESHPQHDLAKRQMESGSNMVAFEINGGKQAAFAALNALGIIDISNNLGDTKSLVTHPATTTHQRFSEEQRADLGISDGLVRLSVGLEDTEDLQEDLAQAIGRRYQP